MVTKRYVATYAARISSRVGSADHRVDDATWCIVAVILLALLIGLHLDRHLLQNRRLPSTCSNVLRNTNGWVNVIHSPSLRAPHPTTEASFSANVRLSSASGRQMGDTVPLKVTGLAKVKMAMSLCLEQSNEKTVSGPSIFHQPKKNLANLPKSWHWSLCVESAGGLWSGWPAGRAVSERASGRPRSNVQHPTMTCCELIFF